MPSKLWSTHPRLRIAFAVDMRNQIPVWSVLKQPTNLTAKANSQSWQAM